MKFFTNVNVMSLEFFTWIVWNIDMLNGISFICFLTPQLICRTLDTFQIPFQLGDELAVLICNSNVRHELSHSEYPTRRNQCAQALKLMHLNSYKDATIKSLDGKFLKIAVY